MGFLVKYALTAFAITALILFIYDHTVGRVVNRAAITTVRVGVFVSAWTAVTALLGMRGVTKGVSALRQRTKDADTKIGTLPKDVH